MQRREILILSGVFLSTLPISYATSAFIPQIVVHIADGLIRLGVYWVTAVGIAYLLLTILTSLFFTLVAWLFLKAREDRATKGES